MGYALALAASTSVDHGRTNTGIFQGTDTADGGAAGRADVVLELAGVHLGLQHHGAGADHHLGYQLIGHLTGNAVVYAAVSQTLCDHIEESRAAAGEGGGAVHDLLGNHQVAADGREQVTGIVLLLLGEGAALFGDGNAFATMQVVLGSTNRARADSGRTVSSLAVGQPDAMDRTALPQRASPCRPQRSRSHWA